MSHYRNFEAERDIEWRIPLTLWKKHERRDEYALYLPSPNYS